MDYLMSIEPVYRIAYLLKLNYYVDEEPYYDFVNKFDLNKNIINYIERNNGFRILEKIIISNYELKPIDMNDPIKNRELRYVLHTLISDIRKINNPSPALKSIYNKLIRNVNILNKNLLSTVGQIYDEISDPFQNNEFLEGCLDILEGRKTRESSYIGSSILLKHDKKPKMEDISKQEFDNFKFSFAKDYISRVIKYYSLPSDERNKYFKKEFLNSIDDSFILELKRLSDLDLKKYLNGYQVPNLSKRLLKFLGEVKGSTNIEEEHTVSLHFTGLLHGGFFGPPYYQRIYINGGTNKSKMLFLKEFVLRSIDAGIGYNMKGCGSLQTSADVDKDNIVLYVSKEEHLPITLKILDDIAREHPEWINDFGSPLWNCGQINNSFYSIGFSGAVGHPKADEYNQLHLSCADTYNGVFDKYLKSAFSAYQELLKQINTPVTKSYKIQLFKKCLYMARQRIQEKNYSKAIEYVHECSDSDRLASFEQLILRNPSSSSFEKHEKGCCGYITDCYIKQEELLLRRLHYSYTNRNSTEINQNYIHI